MDKAPDAYRTISEVGDDLDLPQHVLRFWETRFAQIKPLKRGGGRRYYRPDDVELLKGIRHLLYKEGYTIKGVQRILKEQGVKAVQAFVRESLSGEGLAPPPVEPAPSPRSEPFLNHARPVETRPVEPVLPRGFDEISPRHSAPFEPATGTIDPHEAAVAALTSETILPQPSVASEADFYGQAPAKSEPVTPVSEAQSMTFQTAAISAPVGQVSMFRGGLQRGEGTAQPAPMAEFANQIRERVEHPGPREMPGHIETPALGSRDALLMALEELIACRAVINQVLAGRQE